MKNKLKLIGIIALAAVIGFTMLACDSGGGGGGGGGGKGTGGKPPPGGTAPKAGDEKKSSKGIDLVWIPAGNFTMGSSDSQDAGANPPHSVTLSKGFWMGKYPVTQKQYFDVMNVCITAQQSSAGGGSTDYGRGDLFPMYYVSWYDAIEFCNKLSVLENLDPVYHIGGNYSPASWVSGTIEMNRSRNGYRLPTEAEWEYSCRAGKTTAYSTGDTITSSQANFNNNEGSTTTVVTKYPANPWKLHDMHGNVWEWCWDWYDAYTSGAKNDPTGASSGSPRVTRGGSWSGADRSLRSANRGSSVPSNGNVSFGFRVLRP
jgi:formylglycine-generating enzyme required for sulfatase activity